MERIRVVGCAVAMVLMAMSFCFAADNTPWFAGDITSIGQGVQGFTSVQKAWDTSAYESSLRGVQSAWDSAAAEPSGIGGNWGSGNLVMNNTDGLDEYAKLELSNLIRPFYEKGLAAMAPQQDIHSFLADAKAGKVTLQQVQDYVNLFKANQDAFLGAFEAACKEWMSQYEDQGLQWLSAPDF
ncbi:MAG: hypothetical protein WC547_08320 [Candidatus Omnitrophota bacterium]